MAGGRAVQLRLQRIDLMQVGGVRVDDLVQQIQLLIELEAAT